MTDEIDLKAALNAISDVIQNRPRPLRQFDQIYMKAGDMVMQSEVVAHWANEKRIAFIGDGDSISVCTAYMKARRILGYGPAEIRVFDFDERIVGAINRFAEHEGLTTLRAELYNCLDAWTTTDKFDLFYTNPPWGANNGGASVCAFVERGIEAIRWDGEGLVVLADDEELHWTRNVLATLQRFAADRGFHVSRLSPRLHSYHLDDAPELRSCNLFLRSVPDNVSTGPSAAIQDADRLAHFYGRDLLPHVRYVREKKRLDYGKAHEDEYEFELFEEK